MEENARNLMERLPKEKHECAMLTLATLAFIKEECKRNEYCITCRFYDERKKYWNPCCLCSETGHENPSDLNEYDITERIYK